MSFIEELKRRNVFRVAITYVILAWLMAQVGELLLETFGAPDWVLKSLLVLFLIGFPFALFFAWAFELTPDGIRKEQDVDRSQSITPQTGNKLDRAIIAVLVLALGYFAWDKFGADQSQEISISKANVESTEMAAPESSLPSDKSIAVLPFDNRSNQESDEFFTSGIHDDLLTQLAQISSLRVISRTSVVQFKDTNKSIREIAELLGVSTILEGGVQRAGNQVRINMQLIDAATDAHLWAQTYDRELTTNNIFTIQSEISTAVTAAMRATLSPNEQARIADVPTQNMEALEEYFKGRAEMDQRTVPSLESARMRFEQARQLDPDFALALAGEAQAIILLSDSPGSYGSIPAIEAFALARPLLERALQVAPHEPQVLAVFGLLEGNSDNSMAALDYYEHSLKLNPSSGEVLNWNRMELEYTGRVKESFDMAYRMVKVDPVSIITLFNGIAAMSRDADSNPRQIDMLVERLAGLDPAWGLLAKGRIAESRNKNPASVKHYYQAVELDDGVSIARLSLAEQLAKLGLADEATLLGQHQPIDTLFWNADWESLTNLTRENFQLDPDSLYSISTLMGALHFSGKSDEAFSLAQSLWTKSGDNPHQIGWMLSTMAKIAEKTEHPSEARIYRDAAARFVQALVEGGDVRHGRFLVEAGLAAIDQRDDDAVKAISEALDRGYRWHYLSQNPIFESLWENPAFQAQVSRHNDLVETEKQEVLAMLCGPDSILTTWEPAASTCD